MQQVSRINLYGGGLNSDDSVERMSQADGKERWNLAYGDNGDGQDLVPANGHRELPLGFDLGSYDGEVLESCKDIETQCIYAFVNVGSDHLSHILEFNANTEVISVVLKDIPFNGGFFRILDFPVGGYVSAKVMDGKLFFADGVNELRKLNIQRAKNYVDFVSNKLGGVHFEYHLPNTVLFSAYDSIYVNGRGAFYDSHGGFDGIDYNVGDAFGFTYLDPIYSCYFFSPLYNGYQKTWNQDQLSLNKPPCLETINASYYNDPSFIGNYVSEKAFKFKIKNIYYDYEESVWSSASNIPLDDTIDGFGESKNIYNSISLQIPCPNPDVKSIKIACCDCAENIWYEVDTIDVSTFNGVSVYTYLFYGNKLGDSIPLEDINKPYHFVPIASDHIAIADNRIIVGNNVEDYDVATSDISVIPEIVDIETASDYLSISSSRIVTQNNFEVAQASGTNKHLLTQYVDFYSPLGLSSIPPSSVTPGMNDKTISLSNSFSTVTSANVSLSSNGVQTVYDFIHAFSQTLNNVSAHLESNGDDLVVVCYDAQSFVTDIDEHHIRLTVVYGLRAWAYMSSVDHPENGWDFTAGGFDSISPNEFVNTNGGDLYSYYMFSGIPSGFFSEFSIMPSTLSVTGFTSASVGSVNRTYTSGSAISVGIGYYDHCGRFMPITKSKDVFIPLMPAESKRWRLNVNITGDAPSYAEKYSIFQTESNIQDKAQVIFSPTGDAFYGGVVGDVQTIGGEQGNAMLDLYLTGVDPTNTDNGVLYWGLDSGDGVPQLTIYSDASCTKLVAMTLRERHKANRWAGNDWVISGLFGSGNYSGGMMNGLKSNYSDAKARESKTGISYQSASVGTVQTAGSVLKLEVDADQKRMILKLNIFGMGTSIGGYVVVRTNMADVPASSSNQIITELYQGLHQIDVTKYNQDELNRYRFNIASYLNALKRYDTKDGYNPEVGDYVRVIKSDAGYNTNGEILRITKLGDIYTSNGGYFQYAYVYTEKTDSVYSFQHGGVIELLKIKNTQQSIYYSESVIRDVVYSNGHYVHVGDGVINGAVNIKVDAGTAYMRPRYLVKPNGDVSDYSYLVEDYRISDAYKSRVYSYGQLNVLDKTSRQRKLFSEIRHGGRLLDETKVNKTCEFSYADTTMLDEKFGAISGLEVDGNVLKVFQRKNVTSIYIGQNIIKQANGGDQYVISDKVLDAVRPSTQLYGTEYSRSIVNVNGDIYFWDKASSSPCKATQGGVFPLAGRVSDAPNAADFKMARFFESMVAKQNTFAKSDVIASYSHKYRMVMFSFIFSDIIGNISPESLTIGFHEPTGRWFMKYNFVLDNFQEISSRSYTLAFDIANTPSSVPVFMSIFEGADALAFGNLSTERVGETLAQHGVLEVNANNPIGSRKIYDAVLMDMNIGVYYGDKNSRILTFDTPSSPTLKAQNSYVNLSSLKPEENRMVVNIPRNANTYAGKSAVQNMRNGDEMQGENLKITMSMNKAIFEDVPDYSIREIDVVTSSFR